MKTFYHSHKLARIVQLKLQNRYVKCFWITMCLMLGKSHGKTKQYRALCKTLIKILLNKNIVNQVATNISFFFFIIIWLHLNWCWRRKKDHVTIITNFNLCHFHLYWNQFSMAEYIRYQLIVIPTFWFITAFDNFYFIF